MGRWTQYDEDDHLPEGMERVGYDADTQRYTFRRGKELWLGEPGCENGGKMTRAGTVPDDDELEEGPISSSRLDGYHPLPPTLGASPLHPNNNANAYRMFLPYMLLIAVFLLFVWRFIVGHSAPIPPSQERMCPGGSNATKHHVQAGDTCWKVAQSYGKTVDALLNETLNPGLECERLRPGDVLCIPDGT